jgi:nuclear protein localization family protein 4
VGVGNNKIVSDSICCQNFLFKMIVRLRSPAGQFRVEVDQGATSASLKELIAKTLGYKTLAFTVSKEPSGLNPLQMNATTVESLGLRNGEMLYTTYKEVAPVSTKKSSGTLKFVKQHPVDKLLLKEKGTIKRSRNPTFCKHADMGMCEYCLPLQPYDAVYLEENKIKHMSFHAYLRQIVDRSKIPSVSNEHFVPPLDIPNYRVLDPCPSNSHAKYPEGICSKCQPSAITLQTQNFRMVDHVEFEDPSLIENFLSYWRASGNQRCGFLFGRYEVYDKVPLGVKAVVSVVYEPPQICGHDNVQLEYDGEEDSVLAVANSLGLEKVGVIYTDLFDDGTGKGTVICKRHARSYFLSSAEIIFSSSLQQKYPVKTPYSPTSEFGSRFVTCVVSGIFNLT